MTFLSPHELRRLLKRYGVEIEELKEVERVELHMSKKKIILRNPQVVALKFGDQLIYQIVSKEAIEELPTEVHETAPQEPVAISEDDIKFVMEYTGVPYDKAKQALIKAKGDIAKAIMILTESEKR